MIKNIVIIGCLVIFINCNSQEKKNFKEFDSTLFKLLYYKEWVVESQTSNLYTFSSKKENFSDPFNENFNVLIQDLSGMNMSLESFTNLSVGQIKQAIGLENIILQRDVLIDKFQGKEIIFRAPMNIRDRTSGFIKLKQRWLINNNKAYILTYTSYEKDYDKYLYIVDEMFSSFKLIAK